MTTISQTEHAILREIEELNRELTIRVEHYSRKLPSRHSGKKYCAATLRFGKEINEFEDENQQNITALAEQIGKLAGNGWSEKPDIVALWYRLAVDLTNFSEHPAKKVATVIVDKDNRLISYGVNRIPPGVKKRSYFYQQGERKNYNLCSERLALAKALELKMDTKDYSSYPKKLRRRLYKKDIANFTNMITEVGRRSTLLRDSTMIVTTTPCGLCAPAIAASGPHMLITNGSGGENYTRSHTFNDARKMIQAAGVKFAHLSIETVARLEPI